MLVFNLSLNRYIIKPNKVSALFYTIRKNHHS